MTARDIVDKFVLYPIGDGIEGILKVRKEVAYFGKEVGKEAKYEGGIIKDIAKRVADNAKDGWNGIFEQSYWRANHKELGRFKDATETVGEVKFIKKHPVANIFYGNLHDCLWKAEAELKRQGYKGVENGFITGPISVNGIPVDREAYWTAVTDNMKSTIANALNSSAAKAGYTFKPGQNQVVKTTNGIDEVVAEVQYRSSRAPNDPGEVKIHLLDPKAGQMVAYTLGELRSGPKENRFKDQLPK